MEPSELQSEAEAICSQIDGLKGRLKEKTVSFEDAKEVWDSVYRARARVVSLDMISDIPSEDPYIRTDIQFSDGKRRYMKPNATRMIDEEITAANAIAHLDTVSKLLRKLITHHKEVLAPAQQSSETKCASSTN